jgi:hypothetical protein
MPSTSAKQHRFMQAVAHSPSFAKKAGVSQSVGKDFSAADKGKTFKKGGDIVESKKMMKKGGMAKGGMHKMPDGKMMKNSDMKMGGTKKGGMPMKDGKPAFLKKMMGGGMAYANGGQVTKPKKSAYAFIERYGSDSYKPAPPNETKNLAVTGRTYHPKYKNKLTMAGDKKGVMREQMIEDKRKEDVAAFGMPTAQKIQENRAENKGYLEGQNKYPAEARLQKDLAVPARIARKTGVYLKEKYGDVKGNVKGMFGDREALRELRGSQLSREAALGYKKGGMAYAKGGGIESRGKTKGTVIRMAAGGSVSARADGIAQRGKTKFKNY